MSNRSDYVSAYERAQSELADLLTQRDLLEKRIVVVRQALGTLATLCESEKAQIEPSAEAAYLLQNSSFADEIRAVMRLAYPEYLRPVEARDQLEKLGHDLSKYQNPMATIHMVLKRMAESGEIEEGRDAEDKSVYRRKPVPQKMKDAMAEVTARWNSSTLTERISRVVRAPAARRVAKK